MLLIYFFSDGFPHWGYKESGKTFFELGFSKTINSGMHFGISLQELNDNKPVGGIKTNCKDPIMYYLYSSSFMIKDFPIYEQITQPHFNTLSTFYDNICDNISKLSF